MTDREALLVATKLLGKGATVNNYGNCEMMAEELPRGFIGPPRFRCTGYLYYDRHPADCKGGKPRLSIGRTEMGLFNMIYGAGMTWEECLDEAAHHHCTIGMRPSDRDHHDAEKSKCPKTAELRMAYKNAKVKLPTSLVERNEV